MRTWRHRHAVRVRPLTLRDGAALDAVFAGLSPDSRRLRFHHPLPVLDPRVRQQLLEIDGFDHVALVAEARARGGWRPVGIARFIRTPGGHDAEIAYEVADAWQGRGIGTRLVSELVEIARHRGVQVLRAHVLEGNLASLALLRRVLPAHRVVRQAGGVQVVADLAIRPLTLDDLLSDLGAPAHA